MKKVIIASSYKRFIFNPFKKMLKLFKFNLKTPLSSRLRRSRKRKTRRGIFRSLRKAVREYEDEATVELKSLSDTTTTINNIQKAPFSSPLTPAYVRMMMIADVDDEDACRRFEKCLAGMVVGEEAGNMMMDVQDLVYCWENLKCPAFLDLVSRFYKDLCNDVFDGLQTTREPCKNSNI